MTENGSDIFEMFSGLPVQDSAEVDIPALDIKPGDEIAVLGRVTALEYVGTIDGEEAEYRHEYTSPVLLLAPSKDDVLILFGRHKVTPRGIVDKG